LSSIINMERKLAELVRSYQKGKTGRRSFLRSLAIITGGSATALAIIPVLEGNMPDPVQGNQIDPGLITEFIKYDGETGPMKAYLARPSKGKKFPAVIVIHENRGLVPHIQDVTRRMAREGFLALAPDALSPLGGTPEDVSNAPELFKKLDMPKTIQDFVDAVKYLKTNPLSTGKVGCTGFCWGGGMTNQVAVNSTDLDAAVPYYGRQPSAEDVEKIKAPILAHYAENDPMIDPGIPAFEDALKKYHKEYQIFIYPGTSHAFNNDTNPERYNEGAAKLAWSRTIAFFREKLKS
jgi:carboxymethylenebutenolidase